MPFGNGTGPNGLGPMTGRGAGYCAGYGVPGNASSGARGGWGRGNRNWYRATGLTRWQRGPYGGAPYGGWGQYPPAYPPAYAPAPPAGYGPTADEEQRMLSDHIEGLENQLQDAKKRLEELESRREESDE